MGYKIRQEFMNGQNYFMIYRTWWFFEHFIERWNTRQSAITRLKELRNGRKTSYTPPAKH